MPMMLIGIAKNALQATALTKVSCAIQVSQAFVLQGSISWKHPAYPSQSIIV